MPPIVIASATAEAVRSAIHRQRCPAIRTGQVSVHGLGATTEKASSRL